MRLGVAVLVVPRRRPYLLAHVQATADVASDGRIVAGVGLGGVVNELAAFGEEGRPVAPAAMTDEALDLMTRLWSGETVTHRGAHYTVRGVRLDPVPVQRPRIPIWVGGEAAGAVRRAARWDGWIGAGARQDGGMSRAPGDVRSLVDRIAAERSVNAMPEQFDVALTGDSGPTLSATSSARMRTPASRGGWSRCMRAAATCRRCSDSSSAVRRHSVDQRATSGRRGPPLG